MNRNLLVTLLRKNIEELEMITEGFMEMSEYPKSIILLAQRKTEDIQSYIQQLSTIKAESPQSGFAKILPSDLISVVSDNDEHTEKLSAKVAESVEESISELVLFDEVASKFEDVEDECDDDEIEDDEDIREDADDELLPLDLPSLENVELEAAKPTENTETSDVDSLDEVPRKTFLGEKNSLTVPTRNELLSKADNSISTSLANKKISDIKQAISIGERFRFQRELFKGNGEDMNKTLTYINQLATLDEVMSFLKSKYNWVADNETADEFYQIVKRRF